MQAPDLAGLGVCPSLFPSPQMRGVARREGAWPGFRQTGPVFHGRARNAGTLDAHDACVRVFPARHAASTAFAFTASRTGPRSLCRGEASRVPPGDVACGATLAGAASRPTFTTPRDDAPRWTGRITHSELNPKVNSPGLELGASQGQWKGHSRQGPSGTTLVPCSSRPTKLREVRQSSIQGASYP